MPHSLNDLFDTRSQRYACERPVAGIDLGSRAAKGVLLTSEHIYVILTATGLYMQETAGELIAKLLGQARTGRNEIAFMPERAAVYARQKAENR